MKSSNDRTKYDELKEKQHYGYKYLAGFIESWGRGYEKIKKVFENENLQVPTFEQVRGGVLATIPREIFTTLNKQNVGDNVGENVVENVGD